MLNGFFKHKFVIKNSSFKNLSFFLLAFLLSQSLLCFGRSIDEKVKILKGRIEELGKYNTSSDDEKIKKITEDLENLSTYSKPSGSPLINPTETKPMKDFNGALLKILSTNKEDFEALLKIKYDELTPKKRDETNKKIKALRKTLKCKHYDEYNDITTKFDTTLNEIKLFFDTVKTKDSAKKMELEFDPCYKLNNDIKTNLKSLGESCKALGEITKEKKEAGAIEKLLIQEAAEKKMSDYLKLPNAKALKDEIDKITDADFVRKQENTFYFGPKPFRFDQEPAKIILDINRVQLEEEKHKQSYDNIFTSLTLTLLTPDQKKKKIEEAIEARNILYASAQLRINLMEKIKNESDNAVDGSKAKFINTLYENINKEKDLNSDLKDLTAKLLNPTNFKTELAELVKKRNEKNKLWNDFIVKFGKESAYNNDKSIQQYVDAIDKHIKSENKKTDTFFSKLNDKEKFSEKHPYNTLLNLLTKPFPSTEIANNLTNPSVITTNPNAPVNNQVATNPTPNSNAPVNNQLATNPTPNSNAPVNNQVATNPTPNSNALVNNQVATTPTPNSNAPVNNQVATTPNPSGNKGRGLKAPNPLAGMNQLTPEQCNQAYDQSFKKAFKNYAQERSDLSAYKLALMYLENKNDFNEKIAALDEAVKMNTKTPSDQNKETILNIKNYKYEAANQVRNNDPNYISNSDMYILRKFHINEKFEEDYNAQNKFGAGEKGARKFRLFSQLGIIAKHLVDVSKLTKEVLEANIQQIKKNEANKDQQTLLKILEYQFQNIIVKTYPSCEDNGVAFKNQWDLYINDDQYNKYRPKSKSDDYDNKDITWIIRLLDKGIFKGAAPNTCPL